MNYYTPIVLTNNEEFTKSSKVGQKAQRWAVTAPKTKPIYGLEKGSVLIDEAAAIVAARIDDCLRLRSVEAKFDSNIARVFCKTSTMVQYEISLYAGENGGRGNGNRNDSTFVEVMKVKGCGLSFTEEYKAIVDAAKGLGGIGGIGGIRGEGGRIKSFPDATMLTVTPDMMDLYTPPTDVEIEDMLDRATDQLHSKHDSAVIFALQNLYSMVTPDKCYSKTADQVSKYIIGNYNCVRDVIASIFTSRVGNMKNDERNEQICNLSLDVLICGMQAMSSHKYNGDNSIVDYEGKHFVQLMVPALVETVANYNQNTHTACLAMKCLCFMATSSSLARTTIGETNIWRTVEEAKTYGSMEHFRLEQEAHSTIKTLQSQLILVA